MRIVFSGAGPMTVITTRALTEQGHDVIIIEVDKDKIDRISDDQFNFVNEETSLQKGDEVVVLTHSKNLLELRKRWDPKQADENN